MRQDPSAAPPLSVLYNESTSEPLRWNVEADARTFTSRFEAAGYLYEAFRAADAVAVERGRGIGRGCRCPTSTCCVLNGGDAGALAGRPSGCWIDGGVRELCLSSSANWFLGR